LVNEHPAIDFNPLYENILRSFITNNYGIVPKNDASKLWYATNGQIQFYRLPDTVDALLALRLENDS
jgi:hypothetical protein